MISRVDSKVKNVKMKTQTSPAERCWSGRSGSPAKRLSREIGTVGSNPTLSAIFCARDLGSGTDLKGDRR